MTQSLQADEPSEDVLMVLHASSPAVASSLSSARLTVHRVGGISEPPNEGLHIHLGPAVMTRLVAHAKCDRECQPFKHTLDVEACTQRILE